ncbi:MAG: hypothetical protein E7252_00680 [Lachnospira sp.]|nr:hypothetical protein [Lachnospira sp.]
MANKVLSIKMDENDIERLKKCYKALVEAGFLSSETITLNAFYKHLLLDYLEYDIYNAFSIYSDYGISPKCINPNEFNDNSNVTLTNIYNLDVEMFEVYKKCVQESLTRSIDTMKKNAKMFNELIKAEVVVTEGSIQEMRYMSYEELSEQNISFWENKAFETKNLLDKTYTDNVIDADIEMIEKSSISDELKQILINEIIEYEKKRKQNYNIIQGIGIVK